MKSRHDSQYAKDRYPTPCGSCGHHRALKKNALCRRCNERRGLRQCRQCDELLPIELSFQGEVARCRTCCGIGTKVGRPRVFAETDRKARAVALRAAGKTWRQIAKIFECSVPTIARLFRSIDKGWERPVGKKP